METTQDKFYELITETRLSDIINDIKDNKVKGLSWVEHDKISIITDGTNKISITDNSYTRSNPRTLLSDNPDGIAELLYIIKAEENSNPQPILTLLENYYNCFITYLGG